MDKICRKRTLCILLVLLTTLLVGCDAGQSDPADETKQTVTVERGSLVTSITAVGGVFSQAQVVLALDAAGHIATVLASVKLWCHSLRADNSQAARTLSQDATDDTPSLARLKESIR